MAPPRSRAALMNSLKEWAAGLTPRNVGLRGKIEYLILKDTRSSITIRVQDDHEGEVVEYKITIREHLEGAR